MYYFNKLINTVDGGRKGRNTGIPLLHKKLTYFIPNIQQKTYYLVGALPKVGKTSFVDEVFLYSSLSDSFKNKDNPKYVLHVDYLTLEIDLESKLVNFASWLLYKQYNVQLSFNELMGYGGFKISDDDFSKLKQFNDVYTHLNSVVTFHTDNDYSSLDDFYKAVIEKNKQIHKNKGNLPVYHLLIVDHIGLTGDKSTIDSMSQYCAKVLRNVYSISPIIVQQFSFESESTERRKGNEMSILPTSRDFGDSKYTTRDANIVMGLTNPYYFGLSTFKGYDIVELDNNYRCLTIIVNRNGGGFANLHYFFNGKTKTFIELPKPSEVDYNYFKTLITS